ncbi:MAG TPA: hypothetical protein DD412_07560 [Holosporales bacterium]|nr:hypothetical protein [Holosporales bacterium]
MTFIKKHKKSLIVGVTTFVVGFVSGQIYEVYCYHQQLEQKVLSQVFSQQDQMRQDREEASRKFHSQAGSVDTAWKELKERNAKIDEERRLKREEIKEKPFGSEHRDFLSKVGKKK